MKLFTCKKGNHALVILAFNKGHAVRLLSKELSQMSISLNEHDKLNEIDIEDEKKGKVIIL